MEASTEPSPVVMDTDGANLHHLTGESSGSSNEEGGAPWEHWTVKELQGGPGNSFLPAWTTLGRETEYHMFSKMLLAGLERWLH